MASRKCRLPNEKKRVEASNKTRKELYTRQWNEMFKLLCKYKDKHGDPHIPPSYENRKLAVWVGTQRTRYKCLINGQINTAMGKAMWDERFKKLSSIGFRFHFDKNAPRKNTPRNNDRWNFMFKDLKAFHKKNGHFVVPKDYKNNQLSAWISCQRCNYKRLRSNLPAEGLTEERVDRLKSIGFPFEGHELRELNQQKWEKHLQEFLDFKKNNGNIPAPTNTKLSRWVSGQRTLYRRYKGGQKSYGMDEDRAKRIESKEVRDYFFTTLDWKIYRQYEKDRKKVSKRGVSNSDEENESVVESVVPSSSSSVDTSPTHQMQEQEIIDPNDLLDFRVLLEPIALGLAEKSNETVRKYKLKVEQSGKIVYHSEFQFTSSTGPQKIQLKVQNITLNLTFNE